MIVGCWLQNGKKISCTFKDSRRSVNFPTSWSPWNKPVINDSGISPLAHLSLKKIDLIRRDSIHRNSQMMRTFGLVLPFHGKQKVKRGVRGKGVPNGWIISRIQCRMVQLWNLNTSKKNGGFVVWNLHCWCIFQDFYRIYSDRVSKFSPQFQEVLGCWYLQPPWWWRELRGHRAVHRKWHFTHAASSLTGRQAML